MSVIIIYLSGYNESVEVYSTLNSLGERHSNRELLYISCDEKKTQT